ncbi:unnamed protein product [Arabis nemorensis]|uniref:Uncharacterized protein n=1 Tax=Arabis nemorensis TaxID=586526 RepID=A0A565BG08_9BRAS|nr:unnamed protein product [Arabis nemorensis]
MPFKKSDDCWAHALARALAALMKQLGVINIDDLPTAKKLLAKINKKLLSKTNSLDITIKTASSILKEYGYELSAHHRLKMHRAKENEAFEKYIEQLAIGPVTMCFPYVEGYERFKHKNKSSRLLYLGYQEIWSKFVRERSLVR